MSCSFAARCFLVAQYTPGINYPHICWSEFNQSLCLCVRLATALVHLYSQQHRLSLSLSLSVYRLCTSSRVPRHRDALDPIYSPVNPRLFLDSLGNTFYPSLSLSHSVFLSSCCKRVSFSKFVALFDLPFLFFRERFAQFMRYTLLPIDFATIKRMPIRRPSYNTWSILQYYALLPIRPSTFLKAFLCPFRTWAIYGHTFKYKLALHN